MGPRRETGLQAEDLHRPILGPTLNGKRRNKLGRKEGTPGYPLEVWTRGGLARGVTPTSAISCQRPRFSAGHRGSLEGAISHRRTEEARGECEGTYRRLCAVRQGGYRRDGARPHASRLPSARGGRGEREWTMQLAIDANKT